MHDTPPALDFLTFHLDALSGLMKQQATVVYEQEVGVSLRDLRLLRLVSAQPGITSTQAVALSHMEKTIVSKLTTELAQRGYLERRIDTANARFVNLYLTDLGRQAVARSQELGQALDDAVLSVLSTQESETLRACIHKLTQWVSTHDYARQVAASRPR